MGLFKILLFNDSRKVGIGLWFFITSHLFFLFKMIDTQTWMACEVMALGLIGGGTVMDTYMKNKKDTTVLTKNTTVTTSTSVPTVPPSSLSS